MTRSRGCRPLGRGAIAPLALRALVARDVMFYDTAQAHGVRGWNGLLEWWSRVPAVDLENQRPLASPDWAVLRWTIRAVSAAGAQAVMPGATAMEVRGGKIVRMTLCYAQVVRRQP